jgi:hypothetical protein
METRAALALSLLAGAAWAHPEGFHKRTLVTLSARAVEVLVTLDVDSGKRSQLLRAGADQDRDGALCERERQALRRKLARLAARGLRLEIADYPVRLVEQEAKLNLRGDRRASEAGLSAAVRLEASLPAAIAPGMTLGLEDLSPDRSHVAVQIHQAGAEDAPAEPPVFRDLLPGEQVRVRLGRLAERRLE